MLSKRWSREGEKRRRGREEREVNNVTVFLTEYFKLIAAEKIRRSGKAEEKTFTLEAHALIFLAMRYLMVLFFYKGCK
jgi:hypothetical protein